MTRKTGGKPLYLIKDTFILEDDGYIFLYAPLIGKLARINNSAANYIRDIIANGGKINSVHKTPFVSQLIELGLLSNNSQRKFIEKTCNTAVNMFSDGLFSPPQVTLNITNQCPLKCVYCFSSAGDKVNKKTMSFECGKAAIDLVFKSVKKRDNLEKISILFFGEAEPTSEWQLLKKLIYHAETCAKQIIIPLNLKITTNGFISDTKCIFLAQHFHSITLSFDGPQWVQDSQRPVNDGGSSFNRVFRTAKILYQHAPEALQITCVVTNNSATKLLEIIDFFIKEFPGVPLSIQTVEEVGRAVASKTMSPKADSYIPTWQMAREYCSTKNLKIRWSVDMDITPRLNSIYCGISVPSFNLDVDGDIVSCFSHCTKKFKYGFFDSVNKQFIIDNKKIKKLNKLNYKNSNNCINCFAKYHCLGDCAAMRISGDSNVDIFDQYQIGHGRCELIRGITLVNFETKIFEKGEKNDQ